LLIEARSSRFDSGVSGSFQGKVTQVQWSNPRSIILVDAGPQKYAVQLTTPNALVSQGLTRFTITVGQEVVVQGMRPNQGRTAWDNPEVVQASLIPSLDDRVVFDWSKVPEATRAPIEPVK